MIRNLLNGPQILKLLIVGDGLLLGAAAVNKLRYGKSMEHHVEVMLTGHLQIVEFPQGCGSWVRVAGFFQASTMVAPKVLEQLLSAYDAREAWRLGLPAGDFLFYSGVSKVMGVPPNHPSH